MRARAQFRRPAGQLLLFALALSRHRRALLPLYKQGQASIQSQCLRTLWSPPGLANVLVFSAGSFVSAARALAHSPPFSRRIGFSAALGSPQTGTPRASPVVSEAVRTSPSPSLRASLQLPFVLRV
ncbi:hypothetical protein FB451DRAFT_1410096 [Mycena latifolia]|nr:hypothetical protein FB451DRAFT_1410096 [Mycena latifolia]